jgi:intraflagellar transport protein 56
MVVWSQDETYRQDYTYISWLARCYIHNNNGRAAWDLYLKLETKNDANVLNLIQLIANDCYQTGQFYFAAKAFDLLERHDPDPEYWEGKRGAIVGVFQQVVAGKEREDNLVEMMKMLRETSNPQVEYIMRTITKWCSDNGINADLS